MTDLLVDPERLEARICVFVSARDRARLRKVAERESDRRGRTVSQSEVVRAALGRGLDLLDGAEARKSPRTSR